MGFSVEVWREQLKKNLSGWRERFQGQDTLTMYYFLATMSLWPAAEAFASGDALKVGAALAAVCGDVGVGLLGSYLQNAKDQQEIGQELQHHSNHNPELQQALTKLLQELQTLPQAEQTLSEADRRWFTETLRAELAQQGHPPTFYAQLRGSGVIAQGENIQIANNQGTIINNQYYGKPTKDPQKALAIYCQLVVGQCEHLPLRGVAKEATDAENSDKVIGLAQVYVALDTTTAVKLTEEEKEAYRKQGRHKDTRPLTVSGTADNV